MKNEQKCKRSELCVSCAQLNKPCPPNVLNYDTIHKLVLSYHLNKMHPLLPQLFQTLRYVQDLGNDVMIIIIYHGITKK